MHLCCSCEPRPKSIVLQCFERGNTVKLHNRIMFDFHPGLPHITKEWGCVQTLCLFHLLSCCRELRYTMLPCMAMMMLWSILWRRKHKWTAKMKMVYVLLHVQGRYKHLFVFCSCQSFSKCNIYYKHCSRWLHSSYLCIIICSTLYLLLLLFNCRGPHYTMQSSMNIRALWNILWGREHKSTAGMKTTYEWSMSCVNVFVWSWKLPFCIWLL